MSCWALSHQAPREKHTQGKEYEIGKHAFPERLAAFFAKFTLQQLRNCFDLFLVNSYELLVALCVCLEPSYERLTLSNFALDFLY